MDDCYRQRFLQNVGDAELAAKPFLSNVTGLDKLSVSDSFYSFGGSSSAPAVSLADVDQMLLCDKKVWIACRLWAICQKIRSVANPPPQAGYELARYQFWLANPGMSRKAAGVSGGSKMPAYSADLNVLIAQVVKETGRTDTKTIFRKLVGRRSGCITKIENNPQKSTLLIRYTNQKGRIRPTEISLAGIEKRLKPHRPKLNHYEVSVDPFV